MFKYWSLAWANVFGQCILCLCIRSCRHKCIPGVGEVGDNDLGEAAVEENGEGGSNLTVQMENHKQHIETSTLVHF